MANVLVFAEQRDGRLKKAALEAVAAGRRLADAVSGRCIAVVAGSAIAALAEACAKHGADEVLVADHADLAAYQCEPYRDALLAATARSTPDAVLLPATAMGLDLAPRLAARLDVGLLTDVVEIGIADGKFVARRPVYAGKAYATATLATKPAVVTLRPNVFPLVEAPRPVVATPLPVTLTPPRAKLVRLERSEGAPLDVAEAAVVVSGGRGLKGPEHFALVAALAEALGGAVGASRAVVDAGWIPHAHQVGQTGKTVAPKLYIACGISGAVQHLAGMSSSKVIVAINKDPDAPIFKHATYGVVGDLFEVVPELTRALVAYRARHA
jgi:electron transfer flavoprotein alpha subunit